MWLQGRQCAEGVGHCCGGVGGAARRGQPIGMPVELLLFALREAKAAVAAKGEAVVESPSTKAAVDTCCNICASTTVPLGLLMYAAICLHSDHAIVAHFARAGDLAYKFHNGFPATRGC